MICSVDSKYQNSYTITLCLKISHSTKIFTNINNNEWSWIVGPYYYSIHSINYLPEPGMILITPLGNPALTVNSANFKAVIEVT